MFTPVDGTTVRILIDSDNNQNTGYYYPELSDKLKYMVKIPEPYQLQCCTVLMIQGAKMIGMAF